MIQRPQSIFMFLITAIMLAVLFFPLWSKTANDGNAEIVLTSWTLEQVSGDEVVREKPSFYLAAIAILSGIIALISIFQYSNRLRQMQLNALNALFIAGYVIVASLVFIREADTWITDPQQGEFEIGFYFPIAALICNMIANRLIRRDEKLVKSVDRIR